MTPRQQRRLQQKLARKAGKKLAQQTPPEPMADEPIAAPPEPAPAPAPVSERKLIANRANAQLSQGPVSSTGKEIVLQNATRHGLTGTFHVLAEESQPAFDQLLAGYMRAESPVDPEEIQLVQQMAEATWLSNRSIRFQDKCFVAIESGTLEQQKDAKKDLALYLRYMSAHQRTYIRCSTELRRHRNERARAERGFVSQKYREAQENRKKEVHQMRQALQVCRHERAQIQNRISAAKAERLELKNLATRQVKTFAAAA